MHNYALLFARKGDAKSATAMLQRAGNSPAEITEMMAQLFPATAPSNNVIPGNSFPGNGAPENEIADRGDSNITPSRPVSISESTDLPSINPEPGASRPLPPGIRPELATDERGLPIVGSLANAEGTRNLDRRYEELPPAPTANGERSNSFADVTIDPNQNFPIDNSLARNESTRPAIGNNKHWQDMPTSRSNSGGLGTASFEVSDQGDAFPSSEAVGTAAINRTDTGNNIDSNAAPRFPANAGGSLSPNPFGSANSNVSVANRNNANVSSGGSGSAKAAAYLGMEAGGGMFAMNSNREIRQEPPPKFPGPGVSYNSQNYPANNASTNSIPASNTYNNRATTPPAIRGSANDAVSPSNDRPVNTSPSPSNNGFIPSSSVSNMSPSGNVPSSFQSNGNTSNGDGLEQIRVRMQEQTSEIEALRQRLLRQHRKVTPNNATNEPSANNSSQPAPFPAGGGSAEPSGVASPGVTTPTNFENRFARPAIPSSQRPY